MEKVDCRRVCVPEDLPATWSWEKDWLKPCSHSYSTWLSTSSSSGLPFPLREGAVVVAPEWMPESR